MRRTGNLWNKIRDRENLRLAFWKALRGKRAKADARAFGQRLEENLQQMAAQLQSGTFRLGIFHQFTIYDPKQRLITAPCFRERVLHHAIMNVCEPIFERWLIHDTYACRRGKGRVAALQRARRFARRHRCFLKMDIRKYFDSISHARLQQRLERLFKDQRLLELFYRIVANGGSRGKGLPIGSLTSQHFANFYLGHLDRFIKETLRAKSYLRYMDDFAIWSDSPRQLNAWLHDVGCYLAEELGLKLKPSPYINRTRHGMDWLGCRVFGSHLTLNHRSRKRFRKRLKQLERLYDNNHLDEASLQERGQSLVAFTTAAGARSWHFRRRTLKLTAVGG